MRQKTHTPYPHATFDDFTDEGFQEDYGAKNDEGFEEKNTHHVPCKI